MEIFDYTNLIRGDKNKSINKIKLNLKAKIYNANSISVSIINQFLFKKMRKIDANANKMHSIN